MKIAIPIWNNNVSVVFDFASRLLLVDIKDGSEIKRSEIEIKFQSSMERSLKLKELQVDILICGAISQSLEYMVTANGIEVLPYVTGHIDNVINAYLSGQLAQSNFILPGCWPGARRGFGKWRRGYRRRGRHGKS